MAIYSQLFVFCLEVIKKKKLHVWNRNLYLSLTVISAVNEGYELGDEIFYVVLSQKSTTNLVRRLSVDFNSYERGDLEELGVLCSKRNILSL